MEQPRLHELQGLDEVHLGARTRSPPTALLSERIPYPLHLGVTEAGTKWSGSLKSAVGLGTLLADGIGDTIRISLSTFHAEEEVKVAWEILKALKLRERGPDADRLPDLRPAAVRHGHRRRRGRAAPGGLRGPDRGVGARLRRQRHRRGAPRRLRHHRRQGHGHDLLQGRAAEEGADRAARGRAVQGDRPLLRGRQDRPARRGRRRRGACVARRERGRHRDDAGADRRPGGRRRRARRERRCRAGLDARARRHGAGGSAGAAVVLDEGVSPVAGRRFSRS